MKMMIKLFSISTFVLAIFISHAQNVGINSAGTSPNISALLDIDATDKGVLIPRVNLSSTTDVTTIATPATNLLVFNTNSGMTNGNGAGFYYYNGASWIYMVAPANGPGTSGEVLTSQGGGSAPEWTSTSGGCAPTEITNELDASGNPCSGTGCGTTRLIATCVTNCNNLTFNGNSDWRVPTQEELINMVPLAPGNSSSNWIMTVSPSGVDYYRVNLSNSRISNFSYLDSSYRCRCIR